MLNQNDQKLLDEILAKNKDVITMEEQDILRARASYLTSAQVKEYGLDVEKTLEEKEEVEQKNEGEEEEKEEGTEEGMEDIEKLRKDLEALDYKELQALCRENGLNPIGKTEVLIDRIIEGSK